MGAARISKKSTDNAPVATNDGAPNRHANWKSKCEYARQFRRIHRPPTEQLASQFEKQTIS